MKYISPGGWFSLEYPMMKVTSLLPGQMGGSKQMQNMIANNDIDLVIFFHSADLEQDAESMNLAEISRLCDMYNIPLATNIVFSHSYCQRPAGRPQKYALKAAFICF